MVNLLTESPEPSRQNLSVLPSWAMPTQPGIVSGSLRLFGQSSGPYLAIAALPYATLHPFLFWLLSRFLHVSSEEPPNLRLVWLSMTFADKAIFLMLSLLFLTLPYAVAGRGLCRLAYSRIQNQPLPISTVAREMALFFPSDLLLTILFMIITFCGAIFAIVPALFVGAAFSLVMPAAGAERLVLFSAVRRGLKLMSRCYGQLLLAFLCFSAVVFFTFLLQGLVLGSLPHLLAVRILVMAAVAAVLLVPLCVFNIALTLIYCEARSRFK